MPLWLGPLDGLGNTPAGEGRKGALSQIQGGGVPPAPTPRTLYWVGGAGDWADSAHWSLTTGGAGGQAAPVSVDTVILDGASGGGTVTATSAVNALSITMGAFTGTLSFANQTVNVGLFNGSGTATRTVNLTGATVNVTGIGSSWNFGTTTGLTFTSTGSTINISGNGARSLAFGVLTYATVNISGSGNITNSNNAATFAMLNITASVFIGLANFTISNLTIAGSNTGQRLQVGTSSLGTQRTLTVANAPSLSNVDFTNITFAGAAAPVTAGATVGDGTGNNGITFASAKTVYRVGAGNYSDGLWATTSGGATSIANSPLPQDTAVVDLNSMTAGQTLNIDVPVIGAQNWSALLNSGLKVVYNNLNNVRIVGNFDVPFGTYDTGTSGSADVISDGVGQTNTFSTQGGRTITINIRLPNISRPGGQTYLNNGFRGIVNIAAFNGTVQLAGHLVGEAQFTHNSGTLALNGFNLQFTNFASIGAVTRSITATGTEVWLASSNSATGTPIFDFAATGLTFTTSSSLTLETFSGSSTNRILNLAGLTFAAFKHWFHDGLNSGPTITLNGGSSFVGSFGMDTQVGAQSPQPVSYIIAAGTTITAGSFYFNGGGSTSRIALQSSVSGTRATMSDASGVNVFTNIAIKDMAFTGGATWAATTSVDNGNNAGITITP